MTPAEFRAARAALGLTQGQLAPLLGYNDKARISEFERDGGGKMPSDAATLLLRAYLAGWRWPDWPNPPGQTP